MALSITVNGGGTFSASMEEGPVSFTASLGAVPGPKGDTGATGATGVVAATSPITYNSGTQTVGIDPNPILTSVELTNGVTTTVVNGSGITFGDDTTQTTAFVGEARKVYVTARNNSGSTIAAGKVVYLSGATGNKPTVALALADSEATSARTIGITVESIANNADGKVIISGAAENIDTSAFSAGDTVYLSSSVAGGLQTTLPAAPLHGVVIGIVTRANPSVGSIEVAINNYQELKELSDVNVSDRANNDGLFWEASSTTWRSKTIAEVLGLTPIALTSLSASAPISYDSGTGAFTFDSSTFLLKAGNLSGLASTATSRTNLDVYSKAESDALVPAASTTTAGKVELATDAETITGTSTTLATTPSGITEAFLFPGRFMWATAFTAATSGTGATTSQAGQDAKQVLAPTSAAGYALLRSLGTAVSRGLAYNAGIPWSRRQVVAFRMALRTTATDANSVYRVTLGKNSTDNAGDLARRGVGIKGIGGGVVQLQVHNGTTLTTVNSSFTPDNTAFDVEIVSDGAGNVTLYINGSSVATTSAGPSSLSASAEYALQAEAENTTSITGTRMIFEIVNFRTIHATA